MGDSVTRRIWLYRLLFVIIAGTVLFLQLLPLPVRAGRWPGPDLMLALALAWGLRRPDFVPPLLIAGLFLLSDFLLGRPPGLWAALVVLALEFLRSRESLWRDLPFLLEWSLISAVILAVVVANSLMLSLFQIEDRRFALTFVQMVMTVLAYPPIVLISSAMLGVRKVSPGEVDQLGHRL
jgi:rod shape-determining protein MreD